MLLASKPRPKSFPYHPVIALLAVGIALLALGGRSVPHQGRLPQLPAVQQDQQLALSAAAQSPQSQASALAKGKFLIARRDLPDPNFAESVVLLVEYNGDGAMGLIINNRTEVGLSRLLPDIEELKERDDDLFIGGPVQRKSMLLMLVRSRTKPAESNHVFADVYVTGSVAVLEQVIEMGWEADRFRAYAGYAGWGPGQLDNEVARGDWHIAPADADTVFAPKPADVWKRLIERASLLFAKIQAYPPA